MPEFANGGIIEGYRISEDNPYYFAYSDVKVGIHGEHAQAWGRAYEQRIKDMYADELDYLWEPRD